MALQAGSSATVVESEMRHCASLSGRGGGMSAGGSTETMLRSCTLAQNCALGGGGALFVGVAGRATVSNSRVEHNTALEGDGGGVLAEDGIVYVTGGSVFTRNDAVKGCGGAVCCAGPEAALYVSSTCEMVRVTLDWTPLTAPVDTTAYATLSRIATLDDHDDHEYDATSVSEATDVTGAFMTARPSSGSVTTTTFCVELGSRYEFWTYGTEGGGWADATWALDVPPAGLFFNRSNVRVLDKARSLKQFEHGALAATLDLLEHASMAPPQFDNNSAALAGGAVALQGASSGRLIGAHFTHNSAQQGGAVAVGALGTVKLRDSFSTHTSHSVSQPLAAVVFLSFNTGGPSSRS